MSYTPGDILFQFNELSIVLACSTSLSDDGRYFIEKIHRLFDDCVENYVNCAFNKKECPFTVSIYENVHKLISEMLPNASFSANEINERLGVLTLSDKCVVASVCDEMVRNKKLVRQFCVSIHGCVERRYDNFMDIDTEINGAKVLQSHISVIFTKTNT